MSVICARESIAEQLWRYGEDALAVEMLGTDDATYRRVMEVASNPTVLHDDTRGSVSLAEMCALGAIEVLSGSARPAARRRRLPESSVDGFWSTVGRDRDRRGHDGGRAEAWRVGLSG